MNRELYYALTSRKGLIGVAAVVFLVVAGRCGLQAMFTSGEAHSARERVRRMLDGMKPGGDRQAAIAQWKLGAFHVPGGMEAFNEAADGFEAWTAEKEIAFISSYGIEGAEVVEETGQLGEATVIVSGTIDGQPFRLRVVRGRPVEWVE
jgi:HAMP domain-containing protein